MNPEIRLANDRMFSFADLDDNDYSIETIALALSREQRYTNQIPDPSASYSVAQHSVYVAQLCGKDKLGALLHDAHEYVLRDLSSPLKHMAGMEEYCRLCDAIQQRVCDRYNCGMPTGEIKDVDMAMMEAEYRHFFGRTFGTGRCAEIEIRPWTRAAAEREFLTAFHKYSK